jgi:hypothetical protein
MQPSVQAKVERITWSEACKRYPDQWVVVVDMETAEDSFHPFDSGVILSHHDRRAWRGSLRSVTIGLISGQGAEQTPVVVSQLWKGQGSPGSGKPAKL